MRPTRGSSGTSPLHALQRTASSAVVEGAAAKGLTVSRLEARRVLNNTAVKDDVAKAMEILLDQDLANMELAALLERLKGGTKGTRLLLMELGVETCGDLKLLSPTHAVTLAQQLPSAQGAKLLSLLGQLVSKPDKVEAPAPTMTEAPESAMTEVPAPAMTQTITERVETLEQQVMGSVQGGSVLYRLQHLEDQALGHCKTRQSSIPSRLMVLETTLGPAA